MKEYNSIHELYNLYHRIHGTDQSLDRVESVEEARLFFKRYGEDLERASEEAQRESPPFSTWMTDSRFWIAFLVFLGALIAKFRFGIRFSSIVVLSGSAALYPIVCNHNGQSISRKLHRASKRFQSEKLFRWKTDQKIINDTNYFIAKQNKIREESYVKHHDESLPNWLDAYWK